MREQDIRNNFALAFDQVEDGADLSEKLHFGFSDIDIANLAKLHRDQPKYRRKIFDLLEDCNFHTENADFENGEYEKYLRFVEAIPFSVNVEVATAYILDCSINRKRYDIGSAVAYNLSRKDMARNELLEKICEKYENRTDVKDAAEHLLANEEISKEFFEYRNFVIKQPKDRFTVEIDVQCVFLTQEFEQKYGFSREEDAEEGKEL